MDNDCPRIRRIVKEIDRRNRILLVYKEETNVFERTTNSTIIEDFCFSVASFNK